MLAVEQLSRIQLAESTLSTESTSTLTAASLQAQKLTQLDTDQKISTPSTSTNVPKTNTTKKSELNSDEQEEWTYFGMKWRAPFKWLNLISISLFHIYFLYCFKIYYNNENLLKNSLWGKFKISYFNFLLIKSKKKKLKILTITKFH